MQIVEAKNEADCFLMNNEERMKVVSKAESFLGLQVSYL